MEDVLPGIAGRIEDDPVAGLGDALLAGRPASRKEKLPEEALRAFGGLIERSEVGLGDDENVDRRLRPEVVEGEDALGLEEDFRRDLPADDAAEDAAGGRRGDHAVTLSIEAPRPLSFSSIRS
jgi:hypothetical protein